MNKNQKSKGLYHNIFITWLILLVLFFITTCYVVGSLLDADRTTSRERHSARLDIKEVQSGRIIKNTSLLNNGREVSVGIYVDHLQQMSIKDTSWTVDFFVWFNWSGDDLKPGDSFHVMEGEILAKSLVRTTQVDDRYYALYSVTARIYKQFNIKRFPLDNHQLTIGIEEAAREVIEIRYVPDVEDSAYSSRVTVPGYVVSGSRLISKPHAYKTARGAKREGMLDEAIHSQVVFSLDIRRAGWGFYFKMFQGLFVSVAVAFLAFLMKPDRFSDRYAFLIGALFAATGSSYINTSEIPGAGHVTLIDMANGVAVFSILLTMISVNIANYIYEEEQDFRVVLKVDRILLIVLLCGYTAVNLTMAFSAAI